MKNKINLILTFLPLIITSVLFSSLPEKIPMHYNFSGELNRWGSKYEAFIMPIIIIVLSLVFALAKSAKNKFSSEKSYITIISGVLFTFNVLDYIFLYTCFYPRSFGNNNLIYSVISLCFIFLGNFFPKLKQNSFIGIRVPWTLENETVWYKTHRFSGFLWVIGCSIMLILCLFTPSSVSSIVFIIGVAVITIIPCIYAYIIYKKLPIDTQNL